MFILETFRQVVLVLDFGCYQTFTGFLLFFPAQPVMLAQFALGELDREYLDGCNFQYAGFFAFAATGTVLGMHHRQKHGVLAGTHIVTALQRNGLVDHRADAVTHIAAQAQEVETGFLVDQRRQTHLGLVDVGQLVVQRTGGAGLDARDVLTHFARNLARHEIGRAGGEIVLRLGQFKNVVGTVAHAHARNGCRHPENQAPAVRPADVWLQAAGHAPAWRTNPAQARTCRHRKRFSPCRAGTDAATECW